MKNIKAIDHHLQGKTLRASWQPLQRSKRAKVRGNLSLVKTAKNRRLMDVRATGQTPHPLTITLKVKCQMSQWLLQLIKSKRRQQSCLPASAVTCNSTRWVRSRPTRRKINARKRARIHTFSSISQTQYLLWCLTCPSKSSVVLLGSPLVTVVHKKTFASYLKGESSIARIIHLAAACSTLM